MSLPASERAERRAEVRAEQRGPHWIAWIPDQNGKPVGSVVLVGQTREEAEARAHEWARMQSRTR